MIGHDMPLNQNTRLAMTLDTKLSKTVKELNGENISLIQDVNDVMFFNGMTETGYEYYFIEWGNGYDRLWGAYSVVFDAKIDFVCDL
jgi:hypothetical protein